MRIVTLALLAAVALTAAGCMHTVVPQYSGSDSGAHYPVTPHQYK